MYSQFFSATHHHNNQHGDYDDHHADGNRHRREEAYSAFIRGHKRFSEGKQVKQKKTAFPTYLKGIPSTGIATTCSTNDSKRPTLPSTVSYF